MTATKKKLGKISALQGRELVAKLVWVPADQEDENEEETECPTT